jgi:hypothetical protein
MGETAGMQPNLPPAAPRRASRHRHGALALAVLLLTVLGAACGDDDDGGTGTSNGGDETEGGGGADGGRGAQAAGFEAPSDVAGAVANAGLELLAEEQLAVHYHPHLEVVVDGEPVAVPANLGITATGISELHTHDDSGTIHIESATDKPFTLGQLMATWDVELSERCIAEHCEDDDSVLTVEVDGQPHEGDPNEIVFEEGQHILISYGPA